MSNEEAVIVAKDTDVFFLLIYALGQLEYVLSTRDVKIDTDQFISIDMICNNLGN